MKTILFACVHNAGRSQMAAAWFNELADPAKARAISAGTAPGTRVHHEVLESMREVGIDLSTAQPRFLLRARMDRLSDRSPHVPSRENNFSARVRGTYGTG
ncbi:MAG TPA: low molecular weight phosphatase family protein [Polyangiales bacterium]|nr:low molecular weight phosphatase family protein [Polyangiales bacterium]